MDETMMLGLRLTEGVSLLAFEKRFRCQLAGRLRRTSRTAGPSRLAALEQEGFN